MTIRLGLLVDSTSVPTWVARLATRLTAFEGIQVASIVETGTPSPRRGLLDAFLDIDQRIQRGASDPFVPSDLRSMFPHVPVVSPAELSSHSLDLLVSFCAEKFQGPLPRLGLWTWNSLAPSAGFREVLTHAPLMTCDLFAQLPNGENKLLRRAVFATDWISAARNRNHYFIKAASTLVWALKKLWLEGDENFFTEAQSQETSHSASDKIGLAEIAVLTVKQAARKLEKYFRPKETWLLLAGKTPAGLLPELSGSRPVVPPRGVYWADPMAVERDGRLYVFAEEYVRERQRGRIVCLALEDGQVAARQVALERPYHLSYPFVFEYHGEMYMLPETSGSRTIELYRCTHWPDQWEFVHNLMSDTYAVDSTLLELDGRWWLFTNLKSEAGASSWDELHLFFADSPLATDWTPHPLNPVIADVRLARPAGRIFESEGRLYRPSQDCSVRYGYALNVNRIDTLTEQAYAETCVETLHPRPGMRTLHTFTRAAGWDIVDGATRDLESIQKST